MRNNKLQAAMEFLMTYGWAILFVLLAIGPLAYFGVLGNFFTKNTEINLTPYFVCDNLDKNTSVFPAVISQMRELESSLGLHTFDIFGNQSVPKMFNNYGVMCEVPVQLCEENYLFCLDVKMIVPVNYTEYQTWYEIK